ncbi:hypothetical protein F5050DRAFT_1770422 [Lentinula boryana]|uniref:Uncharacterized protein n=1 Tax=Lentinula boryana TaxID=40481 RepID=A0ABQ8Q8W1_9AGAR|nr:hypothetical protein F5050DRAFT_1770422 [Lentinula boryana]
MPDGRYEPYSSWTVRRVPVTNVIVVVDTRISWEHLAALPEVYGTRLGVSVPSAELGAKAKALEPWCGNFTDGQVALHVTVHAGAIVTATTRRDQQFEWLKKDRCGQRHTRARRVCGVFQDAGRVL